MVLETIDWQQKGRTGLEGDSSMPATLTPQTSQPALLFFQPGSSPNLELFGALCDDYIQVYSSSDIHAVVRRTTYSMSKSEEKKNDSYL